MARCLKCHGGVEKKAGLDLRSVEALLTGGESGAAVTPGEAETSLLLAVIQPGSDPHMPPKGDSLAEVEIELIRLWVVSLGSGAGGEVRDAGKDETGERRAAHTLLPAGIRPELAIDFAIERRWVEAEVEPSRRCGDGAFARRIYLDLAGRIPALEELEAFEGSKKSEKRERLVNELLGNRIDGVTGVSSLG
ncbi:MAG TPA: c-type cytochrome domain-containing protein [Verrucomicrobiales bacterium]|nr:c-type cytochrome domain-containing protein [Verrucomicrobiales bacterium]